LQRHLATMSYTNSCLTSCDQRLNKTRPNRLEYPNRVDLGRTDVLLCTEAKLTRDQAGAINVSRKQVPSTPPDRAPVHARGGSVYFLRCGLTKNVKIDCLFDAVQRQARLQTGSTTDLVLEAECFIRDCESMQNKLRKALSSFRKHGDWFALPPRVDYMRLIKACIQSDDSTRGSQHDRSSGSAMSLADSTRPRTSSAHSTVTFRFSLQYGNEDFRCKVVFFGENATAATLMRSSANRFKPRSRSTKWMRIDSSRCSVPVKVPLMKLVDFYLNIQSGREGCMSLPVFKELAYKPGRPRAPNPKTHVIEYMQVSSAGRVQYAPELARFVMKKSNTPAQTANGSAVKHKNQTTGNKRPRPTFVVQKGDSQVFEPQKRAKQALPSIVDKW
jgi:hypothetical protein